MDKANNSNHFFLFTQEKVYRKGKGKMKKKKLAMLASAWQKQIQKSAVCHKKNNC